AGCLIAYGAPPTQAAAAVVVYHAIAFWIPSLGGLAGFGLLRRRLVRSGESTQPPAPSMVPSARPSKRASIACPKLGLAKSLTGTASPSRAASARLGTNAATVACGETA